MARTRKCLALIRSLVGVAPQDSESRGLRASAPPAYHTGYRNYATAPDQVSVGAFVLCAALGAGGGVQATPSRIAPSNARRIASGRAGCGAGCWAIQASSRASMSGGSRTITPASGHRWMGVRAHAFLRYPILTTP